MLGGISTSNGKLGITEVGILFGSKTMNMIAVQEPQGRELQQACQVGDQVPYRIGKMYKVICLLVMNSSAAQAFILAKSYDYLYWYWPGLWGAAYKIEQKGTLMNQEAKAGVL